MMNLTADEKKFLADLLDHHLQDFKKEAATVTDYPHPSFYAGEVRYVDFLEALLKKLKK